MTTTETSRNRPDHFLLPVDDSEASDKAVRYLASLAHALATHDEVTVTLYHALPMPPRLVEHGGAESPAREVARESKLAGDRARWVNEARNKAKPIFDRARELLRQADLRDDRIEERTTTELHDDLARDALDVASDAGCGTIVVGRTSFPWYREITHHHVADELVEHAKDVAVVVVP